jgi:hypothetical protein
MENLVGVCIGIGLSAASGFRLFVPFLVLGVAQRAGIVPLGENFQWMGGTPALIAFSVALLLEVAAYYIPWLDNVLDTLATPAAVAAGTLLTFSLIPEFSPFGKWSMALIAGGGVAGTVQAGSVAARGTSSATTGGVGNPVLSTVELAGSVALSLLSLAIPVVAVVLVLILCFFILRASLRFFRRRRPSEA